MTELEEDAVYWLDYLDIQMRMIYEDPMSAVVPGDVIGDICDDYRKKQISKLGEIFPKLPEGKVKDSVCNFLAGEAENRMYGNYRRY